MFPSTPQKKWSQVQYWNLRKCRSIYMNTRRKTTKKAIHQQKTAHAILKNFCPCFRRRSSIVAKQISQAGLQQYSSNSNHQRLSDQALKRCCAWHSGLLLYFQGKIMNLWEGELKQRGTCSLENFSWFFFSKRRKNTWFLKNRKKPSGLNK